MHAFTDGSIARSKILKYNNINPTSNWNQMLTIKNIFSYFSVIYIQKKVFDSLLLVNKKVGFGHVKQDLRGTTLYVYFMFFFYVKQSPIFVFFIFLAANISFAEFDYRFHRVSFFMLNNICFEKSRIKIYCHSSFLCV